MTELMIVPETAQSVLRLITVEDLAALFVTNRTVTATAEILGIEPWALAFHFSNLAKDPAAKAIIDRAKRLSAELFMDDGDAILDAPPRTDGDGHPIPISAAEVSLRTARSNWKARRAGQRNASYRDKAPVDDEAPAAQTPTINIQITVAQPSPEIARYLQAEIVSND